MAWFAKGAWRQCLTAGLLFLLPNLCSAASAGAAWTHQRYILPILWSGPNNQLRHLRYMLAVAKQLDRTLILTGMFKHYTDRGQRYKFPQPRQDASKSAQASGVSSTVSSFSSTVPPIKRCFKERVPYVIEFEEMLDRQYMQSFTPVITAEELRDQGWDSVIDALVYPNTTTLEKTLPYLSMTTAAARAHMYHDLQVATTGNVLNCDAGALARLRQTISPWRVVALSYIVPGKAEVVPLVSEGLQPPAAMGLGASCWTDLYMANRRLRGSAWLQNIARRYIEQHIGPRPFLAMHVRPQADNCLRLWMEQKMDAQSLGQEGVCWLGHDKLHLTVGPKALAAVQKHGITELVVLTHPHVQGIVKDLLAAVNLTATFISPGQVAALAGCVDRSATFLMLVEQQIAVQAQAFIGTASSLVTETIVYERLANGNGDNEYLDRPFPTRPRKPRALAADKQDNAR